MERALITECNNCNIIIHTNCLRKARFSCINSRLYCCSCSPNVKPIYNPFENFDNLRVSGATDDPDKHYESDITDVFEELGIIRNILNSCKPLRSISEFNKHIESLDISDCNFSSIFKNIDGNKTNFDSAEKYASLPLILLISIRLQDHLKIFYIL